MSYAYDIQGVLKDFVYASKGIVHYNYERFSKGISWNYVLVGLSW
jgi:hypothetical protein